MQPATGITEITFLPDLGRTPATVNKQTGQLYISRKHWQKMHPDQRLFMILHELGHIVLQSSDEIAVDQWAFEQYKKTGRSLKNSVRALTGVLSGKNPEHHTRAMLQLQRAIQEENLKNPAKNKAMHNHAPINPNVGILGAKYLTAAPGLNLPKIHIGRDEDFENKSGRRQARQERKKIKAESKAEKKVIKAEGKAYKKKSVGDANVILATQGINARAGLAKEIFGGAAKVAGATGASIAGAGLVKQIPNILGNPQTQQDGDPNMQLGGSGGMAENIVNTAANTIGALGSKMMQPGTFDPQNPNAMRIDPNFPGITPTGIPAPEDEKKNNTMLYIGIGAVVLVVVLMIFMKK